MYRLLLIIQHHSGFGIEVLQRRAPAVPGFSQTTCSIHISVRILSIPYLSFTQGHQKVLYSYHKQCCLQPQPPQELNLGGSFEVPP